MEVPLSFASSKGVELVVDWFAALAAQPLKTADAQSANADAKSYVVCERVGLMVDSRKSQW